MVAPATAQAAPYCGITWGSLDKSAGRLSTSPLTDVRAGPRNCYDRPVMDPDGAAAGRTVGYVSAVRRPGSGDVIPLRGGGFRRSIELKAPAYDGNRRPTYTCTPAPTPRNWSNVEAWRTFRQLSFGGSYEGYPTIGLGVRARLLFRVFTLAGSGDNSRVVID